MNRFKPRKQKICLSDSSSDFWDLSLNVNREIWRKIPFRQQDEIMKMINSIQYDLEQSCSESYEKLSFDYEVKIANEHQANPEKSEPAKSAAGK